LSPQVLRGRSTQSSLRDDSPARRHRRAGPGRQRRGGGARLARRLPEARAAAEEALARLDALAAGLGEATTAAGAEAPAAVEAGNGGQAAQDAPLLAIGLLGGGVALIGGAAA